MASTWICMCLRTCPHMDPHTCRHIHMHTYNKRNKTLTTIEKPWWMPTAAEFPVFSPCVPSPYCLSYTALRNSSQSSSSAQTGSQYAWRHSPSVKRLTSLVLVKWRTLLLPLVWAWSPLGWSLLVPESLSCVQFDMVPTPCSHFILSWWGTEGFLRPQSPFMCSFPWDAGTNVSSLWIYESCLYRGPCSSPFANRSCWLQAHPLSMVSYCASPRSCSLS